MGLVLSDSELHLPSGSSVPGKVDANPFLNYPPAELAPLLEKEKDPDKIAQIKSAIKQWSWLRPGAVLSSAKILRRIASFIKNAEISGPALNLNYYQDAEIPEGYESILESIMSIHDQYNEPRFDYSRQGERPFIDGEYSTGDFSSPRDPLFPGAVKPRGDGPDPDDMQCVDL